MEERYSLLFVCGSCGERYEAEVSSLTAAAPCPRCRVESGRSCQDAVPTEPGAPLPAETVQEAPKTEPPALPPPAFGKYEIVRELGRGGMGVVYQVHHPDLRTDFALKVLLSGVFTGPEELARFRREAQAAARVRHPGIVAVHDVGEEQGRIYMVMDLVDGVDLWSVLQDPVAHGLPPATGGDGQRPRALEARTALELMHQTAEALAAIHAAGVIHRDLKPSNLLLDRAGRIRVGDFGLARVTETAAATLLTASGAVMGTPGYMSVEQAEGRVREVDERSDVYQLGVILYELLTGRRPFEGDTTLEVLNRLLNTEPKPPTAWIAGIPREVEWICLKAMARERSARYARAADLAEDCRRFLAGEPVQARPEEWWRKGRRWGRRHRPLLALGALAVLVALGATWRVAADARERERLEREAHMAAEERARLVRQVLDGVAERTETYLSSALVLRRSGASLSEAEKTMLPALRAAVERAETEAPDRPEPRHHLGRLYRVLGRYREALAEQELALAKAPDHAPSLHEVAVICAREFARRRIEVRAEVEAGAAARSDAQAIALEAAARHASDPEAGALRARFVAATDRLGAAASAAAPTGIDAALRDCVAGLAAIYALHGDGDRRQGRALLEQALAVTPDLEEAYFGLAQAAEDEGDHAAAERIYARAIEQSPGAASFWLGRGIQRMRQALAADFGSQPAQALHRLADEDFARAESLAPNAYVVRLQRSLHAMVWADRLVIAGRDATERTAAAEAGVRAWLAAAPNSAYAWFLLGKLRLGSASSRVRSGLSAGDRAREAERHFRRAIELDPGFSEAYAQAAFALSLAGVEEHRAGRDPSGLFDRARELADQAVERAPRSGAIWAMRGMIRHNWAQILTDRGGDATVLWRESEADQRQAVERLPGVATAWENLAGTILERALAEARAGRDPFPILEEARKAFDRALELDPGVAGTWLGRARMWERWGVLRAQRKEDPEREWARAESDAGEALARAPGWFEPLLCRGTLYANWAVHLRRSGGDPVPRYAAAEADLGRLIERLPADASHRFQRGVLRSNWGNWLAERKEGPEARYAAADEDFAAALAGAPGSLAAWIARGDLRLRWAAAVRARGGDAGALETEGLAFFDRALALQPGHLPGRLGRARTLVRLGRWAEAAADFARAAAEDPAGAPGFQAELDEARRRAKGG